MKHIILILAFLIVFLILAVITFSGVSAQNMSQMGRVADPQQPYTRADFERECIKMAPQQEPERRKWIARCKHEAP
jgi:hypothetical protein